MNHDKRTVRELVNSCIPTPSVPEMESRCTRVLDELRSLQPLRRFFGDSAEALVLNLLEDEVLDDTELKNIRKLLQEKGARK